MTADDQPSADSPHGPGVHEFFARALGVMDEHPVERVVLDIRANSGGEGGLNTEVVRQLIRRPELRYPGSLIVIIGRRTFSAAQLLAHDLDRWTAAVFIGEPTGSSPQFWGDHRVVELENSGIDVSASSTWWQPGGPYDEREFLPPLLAFEPRFADYAAGRDPALEAALAWEEQELDLEAPVRVALAAGGTDAHEAIAALVRAWDANPRREEGLAAYRRAYELDPEVGTAAAVLGVEGGPH